MAFNNNKGIFYLINEIQNKNLSGVEEYFQKEFLNESDGTKAPIHYACENNSVDIVKFLLSKNCDLEIADINGYRAIHHTAAVGLVDIMEMLIDNNCDLDCRTNNYQTPLNLATKMRNQDCIALLKKSMNDKKEAIGIEKIILKGSIKTATQVIMKHPLSKSIMSKTAITLLDLIIERNDEKIYDILKTKPVTDEDIDDMFLKRKKGYHEVSYRMVHECLLFNCIHQGNGNGFDRLCCADIVNLDEFFFGTNVLDTVAEYGRITYIKRVLSKCFNSGEALTEAIQTARDYGYNKIESIIKSRDKYLDLQYNAGYNRLHIAVFDNDPDMIEYILDNKFVNDNDTSKGVGTPLSLAYSMKFVECIKKLEEKKYNANTIDNNKQSPLDVAMINGMGDYCGYLVASIEDVDARDHMGFSLLEKSVLYGCETVGELLIKRGAIFNRRIQVHPQWLDLDPDLNMLLKTTPLERVTREDTLYSLCLKINAVIYPYLMALLDQQSINRTDGKDNTLLHLSANLLLPDMCSRLLDNGANVDALNAKGFSPLMEMIDRHRSENGQGNKEEKLIETSNVLLARGASVNKIGLDGQSLLEKATLCGCEQLLLKLISFSDPIETCDEDQLNICLQKQYFKVLTEILKSLNTELVKKWITEEVLNHVFERFDVGLILVMLDRAEKSVSSRMVENMCCKAAQIKDETLFKRLLEYDMTNDGLITSELPLMHCLIKEADIRYCQLAMHSRNGKLLINKKNSEDKLPLHMSIENNIREIIDILIIVTIDIDCEDCFGFTPLSLLFDKLSKVNEEKDVARTMRHIRMIICKSGDPYRVNKFNVTAISFCENTTLKTDIETFYNCKRPLLAPDENIDEMICRMCMGNKVASVLRCGHVVCGSCSERLAICQLCGLGPTNPTNIKS